jgi:hypothetical protein
MPHRLIHCPPNSIELTSKIELSHIAIIPPDFPTDSKKVHLTVAIFHRFLMKESQQLFFLVSKRKQIPTLLFISLFRMEFHLCAIPKPQLFQAKIFIKRTKPRQTILSGVENLQLIN